MSLRDSETIKRFEIIWQKVFKRFWHPGLWFLQEVFFVQSFMVSKNFFLLKSSKAKKKHQKLCHKSGKKLHNWHFLENCAKYGIFWYKNDNFWGCKLDILIWFGFQGVQNVIKMTFYLWLWPKTFRAKLHNGWFIKCDSYVMSWIDGQ